MESAFFGGIGIPNNLFHPCIANEAKARNGLQNIQLH